MKAILEEQAKKEEQTNNKIIKGIKSLHLNNKSWNKTQ